MWLMANLCQCRRTAQLPAADDTLLSLELEGSREDVLYDEIYIMIIDK